MSGKKLSSDAVPEKFIEWVLELGCPGEKIPSIEKIEKMCKGQYYMTLRSLIERVEAKDVINHKKLVVFYDDVTLCQEKNLLNEVNSVLPDQLSVWKEHTDVKEKVKEAEARVQRARIKLNELMDKVAIKVIRRNSSRKLMADVQRRAWLLSQVACELKTKIASLEDTKNIANSLCDVEKEPYDIQSTLDRCITVLHRRSKSNVLPLSTPVASSSIVSNYENETHSSDNDEDIQALAACRGDVLWPHLCEKLSTLCNTLSEACKQHAGVRNKRSPKPSMLAYTANLQATLGLETMKNRVHFRRTHQQLAASIEDLNSYVPKDAFELLAGRVQRAYYEARVKSLKASLEELSGRTGLFQCEDDVTSSEVDSKATLENIASLNKCIVKSREELKKLLSSSANTERKIYNIRECLLSIFNALNNNIDIRDNILSRGVQLDFPAESVALLRQFYKKRSDRDTNVYNLSFNMELSDRSLVDFSDNPSFIDELQVYLKKFNLEKNRKLVLDNGETIWVFETIQALASGLFNRWVDDDVTTLLCPSVRPSLSLEHLRMTQLYALAMKSRLSEPSSTDYISQVTIPDIAALKGFEADAVDQTKKRIAEDLNLLERVHKNLEVCEEHVQFWSQHDLKKYISGNRTVGGKTYGQFEKAYTERLTW